MAIGGLARDPEGPVDQSPAYDPPQTHPPASSHSLRSSPRPSPGWSPRPPRRWSRRCSCRCFDSGAIHGTNAIAVRGVGRQAGVDVTVRADGGDLHKVGAAHPLAALHLIAGQAAPPGIGGGGPGQIDLGAPGGCRRQAGRIGWGSRIRTCGGRGHVRVIHTHVAGGIDSLHTVAVDRGSSQTDIAEGGTRRRGDLRKGRAAYVLATLHTIAGDGDIVGGCRPAEIDLCATDGRGDHPGYRARRRAVTRSGWGNRRGPIRLNFGERQGAVVDPQFVERPTEGIAAMHVAERHHMGRRIRFQRPRGRGDQHPIHIHPQRVGAIRERHGHMVPVRVGNGPGERVTGVERPKGQLIASSEIEFFTARFPCRRGTLAHQVPLAAPQHVAFHPECHREIGGAEVVGARIGHRHGIVHPIKRYCLAIGGLACDPKGPVDQSPRMTRPRPIRQRRPTPFVHPQGRHQAGAPAPPAGGRGDVR